MQSARKRLERSLWNGVVGFYHCAALAQTGESDWKVQCGGGEWVWWMSRNRKRCPDATRWLMGVTDGCSVLGAHAPFGTTHGWLVLKKGRKFYSLATSKDISGRVPTCNSANSRWLYSAAWVGDQDASTTQSQSWANHSLPYPDNAKHLARKRQISKQLRHLKTKSAFDDGECKSNRKGAKLELWRGMEGTYSIDSDRVMVSTSIDIKFIKYSHSWLDVSVIHSLPY